MNNLTEFQQYLHQQYTDISESRADVNKEFLSIASSANKSRIELSKHITMLTVGLLAIGVFWQTGSIYAMVGFMVALLTIVFTVFFLRERIDQEGNEASIMLKTYNEMFDKNLSIILEGLKTDDSSAYLQNFNNFIKTDPGLLQIKNIKDINQTKTAALDYGGEIINFLFLLTLTFYSLAFLHVQFSYFILCIAVVATFLLSVLETASFALKPLNKWLNRTISKK